MDDALGGLLARGLGALNGGDWAAARAAFTQAVEAVAAGETVTGSDAGEALHGLGQALFSLGDYAGAVEHTERAFAAFRASGNDVRAAACARFVGYLYAVVYGNWAAMNGWLGRAVRLIEDAGDCRERARIELTRATVTADPQARDAHLAAAAEIAQRHGDTDLVFDAMSQRGLHLVAAGDVEAGMALLDEALAAVSGGEVRDLISIGAMYCKMLHACELTNDVRRAEDWLALADRFVARTNRLPISAICRTHYGGVLIAAGRWADAERELQTSVGLYERTYRALRSAATVRLAALRVRQGRLEEAAELLAGAEHDAYAIAPQVELHLARGEADVALARIERFFREHAGTESTAPVLLLQTRAHLDRGDTAEAARAAQELRRLADGQPQALPAALAEHACGLVAAASLGPQADPETDPETDPAGDPAADSAARTEAARRLEAALAAYARLGLPLEEARARLSLAGVLAVAQPAMAMVEARAALERFQALSATRDADAATSLLRRLGVRGHAGPRGDGTLTGREQEVLALLGQGLTNQDISARLFISKRTAEHHVSNILAKLGLTNRAEATAYAHRNTAGSPGAS